MALVYAYVICGCSSVRPTSVPVGPAHWSNVREDWVHRRVSATAVNSSTVPVVIDCSDARVILPPRSEEDVLVFDGQNCDLQPEETYSSR